ncbi:MAG TPA: glycosyltransferase family 9 protein [Opitutaceae bacterium]|nr:glycosyltransferase family 9 protein [Opitutaceae bacterium]
MNLVIFKTNALGDSVVFLPVVQALRRRLPSWQIALVAYPPVRELYAADISDDDLLLVPADEMRTGWRRPARVARWVRWLRRRRPDAVLLSYDQSTVAHLLARLSGAPLRLGAQLDLGWRRGGLTHAVEWDGRSSVADWHWSMACRLVRELGAGELPLAPPPPDLAHLAGGAARVSGRVVIHPGSKREMTRWPAARYAELAGQLARAGCEVHWVDVAEAPPSLAPGVRLARTPTLRELVALLASASLFVGNNSGPMHLANAVATPMVVLAGPQPGAWDPAWHRDRVRVLRRPELPCQPCDQLARLAPACANRREPLACLLRWDVDRVRAACLELLGPAAPAPRADSTAPANDGTA